MMDRPAAPGLIACLVGGAAAVAAVLTNQAWLLAIAVVAALVAALAVLDLAGNLRRSRASSAASAERADAAKRDSDRMAARAAKLEAEMLAHQATEESAVMPPSRDPGGTDAGAEMAGGGLLDTETDLFNEAFFVATLDKRVLAARRGLRPLALVLIESTTAPGSTGPATPEPRTVAEGIVATLRDSDTACRLDDGRFALVLEDTHENGAVWTTERVRRRLEEVISDHIMWAGIACYPAHAFGAEEITTRARDALVAAKDWPQDRIEVSLVPDD